MTQGDGPSFQVLLVCGQTRRWTAGDFDRKELRQVRHRRPRARLELGRNSRGEAERAMRGVGEMSHLRNSTRLFKIILGFLCNYIDCLGAFCNFPSRLSVLASHAPNSILMIASFDAYSLLRSRRRLLARTHPARPRPVRRHLLQEYSARSVCPSVCTRRLGRRSEVDGALISGNERRRRFAPPESMAPGGPGRHRNRSGVGAAVVCVS